MGSSKNLIRVYESKLATEPIDNFMKRAGNISGGIIVDIGCGKKPYRKYFNRSDRYIGIDIKSPVADINAPAEKTPLEDGSADVVLCNQLLEHVREPGKAITEMARILKKNGNLYLTVPQMGRLHGEPDDYYRFTKWGMKYLLTENGFEVIHLESHGGFFRAFGSHLNFFIMNVFGKNRIFIALLRNTVIVFNNLIFNVFDSLISWDKDTLGYSIIARRR